MVYGKNYKASSPAGNILFVACARRIPINFMNCSGHGEDVND
jgi:hypothetical protein